jgi:hypothetical protein
MEMLISRQKRVIDFIECEKPSGSRWAEAEISAPI